MSTRSYTRLQQQTLTQRDPESSSPDENATGKWVGLDEDKRFLKEVSFHVELLFDILPEITDEQKFYYHMLRKSFASISDTRSRDGSTAGLESAQASTGTIRQQLHHIDSLISQRSGVDGYGASNEPFWRKIRESLEHKLPADVVDAKIASLKDIKARQKSQKSLEAKAVTVSDVLGMHRYHVYSSLKY